MSVWGWALVAVLAVVGYASWALLLALALCAFVVWLGGGS